MKEKPILFSAPMIQAILESRKNQTRRVIVPQPRRDLIAPAPDELIWRDGMGHIWKCPYGKAGDFLWVRETWCGGEMGMGYQYRADWPQHEFGPVWKPSIFMPRNASRIFLKILDIGVERVSDISEKDARDEGVERKVSHNREWTPIPEGTYRLGFANIWDSINEKSGSGWDVNPFVWVIKFKRIEP